MGQPIFVIRVVLDECTTVRGAGEVVNFLRFHGTADSDEFHGEILSGGVDCQRQRDGEPMTLSARYVMAGTDREGRGCTVFIENQSAGDGFTAPAVVTDSRRLSELTRGALRGEISPGSEGTVEIRICPAG